MTMLIATKQNTIEDKHSIVAENPYPLINHEAAEINHCILNRPINGISTPIIQDDASDRKDQEFLIDAKAKHGSPGQLIYKNDRQVKMQSALLLYAVKTKFTLVADHPIPSLRQGEIMVKIRSVGLNPWDWQAPAFNFGIPRLPWIFGRDIAGTVIRNSSNSDRLRVGDMVLVPSTDYRDIRKAAFQEYAVASHYNAARIPSTISIYQGAAIGVAYVAAVLSLGVCFGLDFSTVSGLPGPNLPQILKEMENLQIPEDVRDEVVSSGSEKEQLKCGDWLVIWGASSTLGYIALQLTKLCGVRVICVADIARYGVRLLNTGADLVVDRHDQERAVDIIKGTTNGRLRFGLDVVGGTLLHKALLASEYPQQPTAHLLRMTGGQPKTNPRIRYHTAPIKLFHSSPRIGNALVVWLENLLERKALRPPDIVVRQEGGLADVNDALEILRSGSVSGKRIIIDLESIRISS